MGPVSRDSRMDAAHGGRLLVADAVRAHVVLRKQRWLHAADAAQVCGAVAHYGSLLTVWHLGEGFGHTAKGRRHFAAFLRIEGCQFVKERRWRHLLDRPRSFHLRQTTAA